ncbi:MAG: monovalent cation/H(+) antiporter subunit G [Phycisphaerales bacterium]
MLEILVGSLAIIGALFGAIAAIGIVRMPDLYTRMQSATKAGSLGVACVVFAAAVHFRDAIASVESALVIAFLFGTAPVASILIGQAAYSIGLPLWSQTSRDDLREHLDALASSDGGASEAGNGTLSDP